MKICVLLVTYNRINDLKKALECYDGQTTPISSLIVVNNASTDGTKDFLTEWVKINSAYEKIIVDSKENTGGSGGFYLGMKESLKIEYDYLFLADDDAFADPKMIAEITKFYDKYSEKFDIAGMCTSVINSGRIDTMHRRNVEKGLLDIKEIYINESEYSKEFFEVDEFSFVGALISKEVIKRIGLPNKDYFIYFDDTEYSTRIRTIGKIYCIPTAIMNHNTVLTNNTSWKDYYMLRNSLDIRKKYYGKRVYYSFMLIQYLKKCTIFGTIFKKRTRAQKVMFKKAIRDSINNRICKDDIYCPGVNIENIKA